MIYSSVVKSQASQHVEDDGLTTPTVGSWGEHKYQLFRNYAHLFTTSMKAKWDCLVYMDLFSGAGRCRIKNTSRIVFASPIIALELPIRFDRYIFCEEDKDKINALQQRVSRDYSGVDIRFLQGDTNHLINRLFSEIPQHRTRFKVLTFCFADPFSLQNLQFSTIRELSSRFVDFLILIPSGMDANRNLNSHYLKPTNRTIDKFIGSSTWRQEWYQAALGKESFDVFLTNRYGQNMKELGYRYPGIANTQLIRSTRNNLLLYRLAFFSRHKLGEKFWNEAKKYSDPQLDLL